MEKDSYTIVIFPGTSGAPRKIQIPKGRFRLFSSLALAFLVVFAGSSFYFSKKYVRLLDDQTELAQLRRDSKLQKIQVEKFAQQVKNFETEISRLERFEKKLRVITALENSPESVEENWGVGGSLGLSSQSFSTSLEKETRSMMDRLSGDLEHLSQQSKLQIISFQELDEVFKNQSSLLSSTPSVWPTRGWVTSGFGYRKSPFTGLREKHQGLDIASRSGAEIRATADGVVVMEGRNGGYGKMIEIDHGYGLVTRYGHNSKHLVKVGDRVKRGQIIALVGSTGRSTGPHVHYEVLLNDVPVNPKTYILEE